MNVFDSFLFIIQKELALLGNGHRTASVICKELTELFEIEKETFLEVCPDIFDNELLEKLRVAKWVRLMRGVA